MQLNNRALKEPRFSYGYVIVMVSFLAMMIVFGTYLSFGVFLKPLLADFGWATAMISGAFSLSMIVFGLLAIGIGGLNDKFGPRIMLSLSGALLALGFLLMSQISTLWHLYLLYGLIIGTAVSCAYVPINSTIARWFIDRRTLMTGIVSAGTGFGGLIVSLLATQLILNYNWRVSFIALGFMIFVIVTLAAQFMKRDPGNKPKASYTKSPARQKPTEHSLREAARSRNFWLATGMEFCVGFCTITIMVHIVPHAIELGNSATSAASILATMNGSSIGGRVLLGSTGDRIGNRMIFIICFIILAAALFFLMIASELWNLYLFAVVFGFASGGMVASESPLAASLFGLSSHGMIFGAFILLGTFGASLGPFLAGYLFDINGNYNLAFLLTGAMGILGIIFSWSVRPLECVPNEI